MQTLLIENEDVLSSYKEALDASSIVTKTDLKGRITYANNNFCKISGYTKDELIGQHHNVVRHPNQPSSSFSDLWKTVKDKKVWNGIVENRHKDGTSYYVSATVIPYLDDNGETIEYISIRRDITELHLLKNNLEERVSEEVEKNKKKDEELISNLHLFLDSTPNPIIALDENKNIKFVNEPFLNLVGKDKESMLNQKCSFSELLVNDSDYISCEDDFVLHEANKIAIVTTKGKNIFQLYYKEMKCANSTQLKMYTLNNITKNEYQKLKISHYNEQLQEYYMRSKSVNTSQDTPNIKVVDNSVELEEEILDTSNKQTRILSNDEKVLLKRSSAEHVVSSEEYSHDLDEFILAEIQELDEIEDEIYELIDSLKNRDLNSMHQIVLRLLKLSSVLNNLIEFKELSFSISSLANLLENQNISALDETTFKKMLLFLENITIDLSVWRRVVFIEQSANDIHYMDSSLFSSILQLELIFNTDQEHNDDSDDFELF